MFLTEGKAWGIIETFIYKGDLSMDHNVNVAETNPMVEQALDRARRRARLSKAVADAESAAAAKVAPPAPPPTDTPAA
jgi:hypothetical protein